MIDTLYGLQVDDDAAYTRYRAEMTPLLNAHGGAFTLDVRVAEVLRAPEGASFNRLFSIRFATRAQQKTFFANAEYLKIRARWFTPSVSAVHTLAEHEVP